MRLVVALATEQRRHPIVMALPWLWVVRMTIAQVAIGWWRA